LLPDVATPEKNHVHVVFVSTSLRLYHFLHRRTAVHGTAFLTAFPTQQHLHLPVCQSTILLALKERLLSLVLGPETKIVRLSNLLFAQTGPAKTLTVPLVLQYST
jgi:hypothetical protein